MICGGESGPKARPSHPDWFRSLRDQCAAAGLPFFFKQWGEWQPQDHSPVRRLPTVRGDYSWKNGVISIRTGKKAAGRLLDGREHNEYPA